MGHSNTSRGRGIKGSKYWIQTVIENDVSRAGLDGMTGKTTAPDDVIVVFFDVG